jgi:hypothetical protein
MNTTHAFESANVGKEEPAGLEPTRIMRNISAQPPAAAPGLDADIRPRRRGLLDDENFGGPIFSNPL